MHDDSPHTPDLGFLPIFRTSPYTELIGPLLYRGTGLSLELGLWASQKHCNARGLVHGGIVCSLVDLTMGYGASFSEEAQLTALTTNLNIDFMGSAAAGDWLHTTLEGVQIGRSLIFANCYVRAKGKRIARGSGVFSIVR